MIRPTTVQKLGDSPVAANPLPIFQVQDEEFHVNYLTQITPKIPSNKEIGFVKYHLTSKFSVGLEVLVRPC